jgi:hypothetical protein
MWEDGERRRQRMRVCVFVVALVTLSVAWLRLDSDARSVPAIVSAIDAWFTGTPPSIQETVPSAAAAEPGRGTGGRAAGPSATVGTSGGSGTGGVRDYRVNPSPDRNAVTPGTPRPRVTTPQDGRVAPADEMETLSRPEPCDPRQEPTPDVTGELSKPRTDAARTDAAPCDVNLRTPPSMPPNAK